MIIKDKIVTVYDIEVFPNVFHCTAKDTETGQLSKFEISSRINQLWDLINYFLERNRIFCGYNNLHYDDPIINYIMDYMMIMDKKDYSEICKSIFNLSKVITTSEDGNYDAWKKWKYMYCFESFDLLTMLFSNKLRVSLKEMQVTMHYQNVQEFDGDWQEDLPENRIDSMIEYNINDVNSTEELLNRCKKDIELRLNIEKEYGLNVLSKDGVNIGMQILAKKYVEKTGLNWNYVKTLRSPMEMIPLKDIILPFIKFEDSILQSVLIEMKSQIVSPGRKGYEKKFIFDNLRYSVGVGGIHSVNDPEIIIPAEDEELTHNDVTSLYPSMLIQYKFYPKHLGEEFLETYKNIYEERVEAKHNGDKVKNQTLKLALNGLSGNLQNENSFCYSPFAAMQIRINGQLLLLMLAEQLVKIGCRIVQANTDGLFVITKKDKALERNRVCNEWEQLTKLKLENDQFKALYQYAINDYFGIAADDSIEEKGLFITKVKLGKGLTPKIIPKAVINFFKDNISVEDTIKNCNDIKEFLISEKTGKQWHVEYLDKEQQRTNRFYASNASPYLRKWKYNNDGTKQYQNMLVASGITLLNYLDDKPITDRNINYRYYICEAYKLIRDLKPLQLKLSL